MTKEEVQKRITTNGHLIPMDEFQWDSKGNVFNCNQDDLLVDFSGISNITIEVGSECMVRAGSNCDITVGCNSFVYSDSKCNIKSEDGCVFDVGSECIIDASDRCTLDVSFSSIIAAGANSVIILRTKEIHDAIILRETKRIKTTSTGFENYSK